MQYDFSETVKRFKKIKIIDCQIENKENELLKLETINQKCTANYSAYNFGGGDFNSTENRIVDSIDKKDKLLKELDELKREYSILVKAFETLTTNEKIVIEEYFLKENSLTWISTHSLYYSERQLRRIKLAGMIKLKKSLS